MGCGASKPETEHLASYTGEKQGDSRHGEGAMTYSNGDVYTGEWRFDLWHGTGTLTRPKSIEKDRLQRKWREERTLSPSTFYTNLLEEEKEPNIILYTGQCQLGQFHGKGAYRYPDGGTYKGEWWEGECHGHGTRKYDPTGPGLGWIDLHVYTGEWDCGVRSGRGTLRSSLQGTEKYCYEGEWKNDRRHGEGKASFTSYTSYTSYNPRTYSTTPAGAYIGSWKDDQWHGSGVRLWLNEEQSQRRDRGQNVTSQPAGSSYEGMWDGGECHGPGVFTGGPSSERPADSLCIVANEGMFSPSPGAVPVFVTEDTLLRAFQCVP